jgi:hypothetical protein
MRGSTPTAALVIWGGSVAVAGNKQEHLPQAVQHDQQGDASYHGDGQGAEEAVLHGRPLFDVGGSNAPSNILATGGTAYQDEGKLLGTKLVQSSGVPSNLGGGTNETRIIAVDMRDVFLWEDEAMPIFIKAEQTLAASLQILYVIYSYSAFAAAVSRKPFPSLAVLA